MGERFILEKDNVVLDKQTGLMWQRSASASRIVWKDGFDYIEKLNAENFSGYNDWRYPTKDELATLILVRICKSRPRRGRAETTPRCRKSRACAWDGRGRPSH